MCESVLHYGTFLLYPKSWVMIPGRWSYWQLKTWKRAKKRYLFRVQISMLHLFFRLYLPHSSGRLRQPAPQLSVHPWICAPGTHYGWVDRGSVEYKVCLTLLHMASTGNRTPDPLILSTMPYPLGQMLPRICGQVDRVNHVGILILIIYGDKFITPCNLQEVSALVVHYNSRSCVADCSQAWILPRILTLLHCQAHPLCFTILDHIEVFRE